MSRVLGFNQAKPKSWGCLIVPPNSMGLGVMSEPSKVLQLRYSHFEHSKIFKASKILVFNDLTFLLQDLVRAPQRRATLAAGSESMEAVMNHCFISCRDRGSLGAGVCCGYWWYWPAWNWGDLMISCSTMCHGCESSTPWNSHRSTNHSKNRERERRQQWIVIILICGRFIRTHHKGVFNGMDAFSKCQVVQPAKVWNQKKTGLLWNKSSHMQYLYMSQILCH